MFIHVLLLYLLYTYYILIISSIIGIPIIPIGEEDSSIIGIPIISLIFIIALLVK